jgi:hypothetical protein
MWTLRSGKQAMPFGENSEREEERKWKFVKRTVPLTSNTMCKANQTLEVKPIKPCDHP